MKLCVKRGVWHRHVMEIVRKSLETPETRDLRIRLGTKHRGQQMGRRKGDGDPWSLGHSLQSIPEHQHPLRRKPCRLSVCCFATMIFALCELWLAYGTVHKSPDGLKVALDG
jgi:hypothetical protein